MLEKKEDLFIGRFPGCLVFADKTVYEHGDYKTIAHVTYDGGNVNYFVEIDSYPEWVKASIEDFAKENREEFLKRFERDVSSRGGLLYWYQRFLDSLPIREYLDWSKERAGLTLEESCRKLLPVYMARN